MEAKQDNPDSFFVTLRPLFWLGQFCGVLPLSGTAGLNHQCLTFTWKSVQIVYTLTLFGITLTFNLISTYKNVSSGIHLDSFGWTMFYSVCNLNTIFFVLLARHLPALCRSVGLLEEHLSVYGYPKYINLKTNLFLVAIFFISIFEHSLLAYLNVKAASEDAYLRNITFLQAFFPLRFPIIHGYFGHNDWWCVLVFIVHVIETINWNYLDFFLSVITMQLSGKLGQLSVAIQKASTEQQKVDPLFWEKLSLDFNRMSLLVKTMDKILAKFVLMSFASNIYHLSLQLIRSLKFKGSPHEMAYFYFSLGYLMFRMMCVTLCAAQIHETSQRPKHWLYSLHDPCAAASRLLLQVTTDHVYITGKRFFVLDRNFITKMIGTIVTYEVILIQINALKYSDPLNSEHEKILEDT